MESLAASVQETIQASPWVGIGLVLVGGLLTASNPCVLAIIPLSIAYVGGTEGATNWKRSLVFSLCMALGLSATFALLGVLASVLGGAVGGNKHTWNIIIAAVCLLMGLHLMEVVGFPVPSLGGVRPTTRGALGALLLGVLFGLVATPCAGPILVVLLAYLGTQGASPVYGGALLLAYGLGHCALIIVAGTSMGVARGLLESRRLVRWTSACKKAAGALVVAIGAYFVLRSV